MQRVTLGGTALGGLQHCSATRLTVVVPTAPRFAPARLAVGFVVVGERTARRTALTFRYQVRTGRDRELQYAWRNLHRRGGDGYTYFANENCANFTSQALHAAGYRTTDAWRPYTRAWISSTALRAFLLRSGRAREVGASSTATVRIGDVVQFDWDRSGDRDHTGIATRITVDARGERHVSSSAHTDPGDEPVAHRSVEWSQHHHPGTVQGIGGAAYYLVFGADPARR